MTEWQEIEPLTDGEAEAAFVALIEVLDKLGCAPAATVGGKEDEGVEFSLYFSAARARKLMTTQSPDATEQVERVARAICAVEWPQFDLMKDSDFSERERKLFFDYARAAIAALPSNATTNASLVEALEALREPTDAMIDAAADTPGMKAVNAVMGMHQARGYGFSAGAFDQGSPLHQAWRAMIDTALATLRAS